MTQYSHNDLWRIFQLAMDAPVDQRQEVVRRECGDDPELLKRVQAIVAAADDERFLDAPTPGLGFTPPPGEEERGGEPLGEDVGDQIGRYKLLQRIGEGGFGVVYMAEQEEPVRRRVALKIIKLGMDTKQVIARFEAERQALAMMDHPNIAKVLDAGATETGRPYFVMELVKGTSFTEYCDSQN
ncbi:MAG: protein kinase, partial [Phycisphaerales bacterium JB038]